MERRSSVLGPKSARDPLPPILLNEPSGAHNLGGQKVVTMVRSLRCAAVAALCTLSAVACSEEEAPAPEPVPAAATAVASSSAEPPRSNESSDSKDDTPEPQTSAAAPPPRRASPRQVAAARPAPRALSGPTTDASKPKSDSEGWEDEVAPPGSEVGRKAKQLPEWDPWESRDGTQGNAKK